jgi:hypothetical protein
MPFDFINGLKDKKWTCIDHKWLAIDVASEESSIKQHQTDQIYKAH